VSDEIQLKMN